MNPDILALQKFAGVKQDGDFGPVSARALVQKLNLNPAPAPAPTTRQRTICIDPGHGMSNRTPGVFDPGCERGTLHEADIVLVWAHHLRESLAKRGAKVFLTRGGNTEYCPIETRVSRAVAAGCDTFVSIHVNDADAPEANGTETLYRGDDALAIHCQEALLAGLGLRDRGVKRRTDLAVLHFPKSCLLELGFIGNAKDVAAITDRAKIAATCELLAEAILK